MHDLVGKTVEVRTADISYKGTLVEIGETEIHLRAESGWIVVPVEKVVEIHAV